MKRWICIVLVLCLTLTLAACGGKETGSTEPTESADALSTLRSDMTLPVMAVAIFQCASAEEDILGMLQQEYPNWLSRMDFISQIPEERIIVTGDSMVFRKMICIVPRDPKASVTVIRTEAVDYDVVEETVLYHSDTGEPILMVADMGNGTEILVEVTEPEGRGISWNAYWEYYEVYPEDAYTGHLVMNFTPMAEKTEYQLYQEMGWFHPEAVLLEGGIWVSDYGYALELYADGYADLYETRDDGAYHLSYSGTWAWDGEFLNLDLAHTMNSEDVIQGDFPVLTDPYESGWLALGTCADGTRIPYFWSAEEFDELAPASSDDLVPYNNALSEGWRVPEFEELENSFWLSCYCDYGLELMWDSDIGGEARIYDVNEYGAYKVSYTGSWQLEEGYLHLTLIPKNADGIFVDSSFPVLTLDGQLWIGRDEYGMALPHFYSDLMRDVLEQPKG